MMCRVVYGAVFPPFEIVLDILTECQKGAFTKEDGEKVIDETGKRVK